MKRFICFAMALGIVFSLCGCNRSIIDTTYRFDEAIIKLPDGEVVKGKVDRWIDYEDGDQIQVTIGGTTYLVHSVNATLIANNPA